MNTTEGTGPMGKPSLNDESLTDFSGRSKMSLDGRAIQTIIMEKATHGAIPTDYRSKSDSGWRTVQWYANPELVGIQFSDGTVIYTVSAEAVFGESVKPAAAIGNSGSADGSAQEEEEIANQIQKGLDNLKVDKEE